MVVLGIDTSCDDTSISVYSGRENRVLSNVVSSQYRFHEEFGGVVPEIAARKHVENIDAVLKTALRDAEVDIEDIELISSTYAPGLLPALLVGLSFGKALSFSLNVPFKGVHHIEAHVLSPFIGRELKFPFISLVVSGGHTQIVVAQSLGNYRVIGKTLDDAVGESYDKVAKMLGLGYPGGPVIDRIHRNFRGELLKLPKPKVKGLDFSFSGLKTATRFLIEKGYPKEQIAASFQETAISYLVDKLKLALKETGIETVTVSGGVSANSYLRKLLKELPDVEVILPEMEFTSDNGAMVAYTGYRKFLLQGPDSLSLNAAARMPLP